MITIRPAERRDEDAIWEIFHAVVQPGDSYAFPAEMSRRDALAYWLAPAASVRGGINLASEPRSAICRWSSRA